MVVYFHIVPYIDFPCENRRHLYDTFEEGAIRFVECVYGFRVTKEKTPSESPRDRLKEAFLSVAFRPTARHV